ncbi:MAG: glycine cleavage system protein H [Verrucomicrobiales bacterium]|nr:glycine cleavage system protein H [Verrucomicrobiales bacterium]
MQDAIRYQRATFVTRLPVGYLYAPSHYWLARQASRRWRTGFTKFALRMLGELVEVQFEPDAGIPVAPGDILGSIEGFKAVSDLFCVGRGTFAGGNPQVIDDPESLARDPYGAGWLYEFEGEPDARCLDVAGYQALLDATIDRLLEKQKAEEDMP